MGSLRSSFFLFIISLVCTSPYVGVLAKYGAGGASSGRSIPIGSTIGTIFVLAFTILGTYLVYTFVRTGLSQRVENNEKFEAHVTDAQRTVTQSCRDNQHIPSVGPTSGTYIYQYELSGKLRDGHVNLTFQKVSQGWALRGDGTNFHGNYNILDGRCSHDGTAWWIALGRGERKTLTWGKFVFHLNDFEGDWVTTGPGLSGDFDSFVLQREFYSS